VPIQLTLSDVRRLALACQGLDGGWVLPAGRAGALEVVRRLGYVQIDTLYVVNRAHHHVIWSRQPSYRPPTLYEMLSEDRTVFEWWMHAAAYIPMDDLRFHALRMGPPALRPGHNAWIAENQEVIDYVLARITKEGALGTSAFKAPEDHVNGSWWSGWKPAKRALEMLFNQGKIFVSDRRNFERIYDLRERFVPAGADGPAPTQEEVDDYTLRRSLGVHGALPKRAVRLKLYSGLPLSREALPRAIETGQVAQAEVSGDRDRAWYVWTAALPALDTPLKQQVHILSPFDNLIINRPLMERIYGFDYRMECYVPKAKRQYGYFSLPVLWGDRFIARVDAKADRPSGTLILRHVYFEPDFAELDATLPALAQELRAFADFNACDQITVEIATPEAWRDRLVCELGMV